MGTKEIIISCVERVIKSTIDHDDMAANIIEQYGVDSLHIANILMEIERELDLSIDVTLILPENIRSISALQRMVDGIKKESVTE